jgi:hypothetical protein
MQYTSIKFIPTGNIFKMPTENAKEILKADRGNFYEVVGGVDIPKEVEEVKETNTYNMVVEEEQTVKADEETSTEAVEEKPLEEKLADMKVAELATYCDEHEIKYKKSDKKADLIQKILEEQTVKAE